MSLTRCNRYYGFVFVLSTADDENNELNSTEAEQARDGASKDEQTDEVSESISAREEDSMKDDDEDPVMSGLGHLSNGSKSHMSPLSDIPSPRHSPSHSETTQTDNQRLLSNGNIEGLEDPVDSSNHVSLVLVSSTKVTSLPARSVPLPLSPVVTVEKRDTEILNGPSPPPSPSSMRSQKRKREEITSGSPQNKKHIIINDRYSRSLLCMEISCDISKQKCILVYFACGDCIIVGPQISVFVDFS